MVYASIVLFDVYLCNYCNIRYEWLARPCSAETFILQESVKFCLAHQRFGFAKHPSRSIPGGYEGGCGSTSTTLSTSGGTGASLAHVHAFEEARDPHGKGQRAAQVAEQGEAEGGKQSGEYILE